MAGTENMSEPMSNESETRGGSCAPAPCSADNDDGACERCGCYYDLRDGQEPTPLCDECAQIEVERFRSENIRLREALKIVLASAHPHPMENGAMYEAWEAAKKAMTPNIVSKRQS